MRSLVLAAAAMVAGPPEPTPPAAPEPPAKVDKPADKPCEKHRVLQPKEPTPAQRYIPGLF